MTVNEVVRCSPLECGEHLLPLVPAISAGDGGVNAFTWFHCAREALRVTCSKSEPLGC